MGYVIAAYAIVLGTLLLYWGALFRKRQALQRQLRAPRRADPNAR